MYQYPKNVLTVSQLIDKLEKSGMVISSYEEAFTSLSTIGYYRLKGYCFHLFDKNKQKYKTGTSFSKVINLYLFDKELSNLLFGYLSQIEIALRANLVHALLMYNDPLILNDPSIFIDKSLYWKNQGIIASEISRSSDVFIKHNYTNHDGAIPLWAVVEVMSFGTLSKVISNLEAGANSACSILVRQYKHPSPKGKLVSPSKEMFSSWVHTVSVMRNICAHNSRIYNRTFNTTPQIIKIDMSNPKPQFNGLYQVILSMKYLRPTDDSWRTFVRNLKLLIDKYSEDIELDRMNFPKDWETHFTI